MQSPKHLRTTNQTLYSVFNLLPRSMYSFLSTELSVIFKLKYIDLHLKLSTDIQKPNGIFLGHLPQYTYPLWKWFHVVCLVPLQFVSDSIGNFPFFYFFFSCHLLPSLPICVSTAIL